LAFVARASTYKGYVGVPKVVLKVVFRKVSSIEKQVYSGGLGEPKL